MITRIRVTGIRPGTLPEFKKVARDWKNLLESHGGRVLGFCFDETENKVTGIAEYGSRESLAEIQGKCSDGQLKTCPMRLRAQTGWSPLPGKPRPTHGQKAESQRKILIVPDKFKGTLSAGEAARAIARGWRKARPEDVIELLPMSDGGDGFGEVVSHLLSAKPQMVVTVDAAHRRRKATWWWEAKSKTAIIESANVIGLAMLPPGRFHPFELDTFGLGAVLLAARTKGAKRILIGIGGSATNDGGFGLARALGWEFRDRRGRLIEQWTRLPRLTEIQVPKSPLPGEVIVAVDVRNRLLGARGATRVYGPQKGIRPEDFACAESCLRQLARVVKRQFGCDFARLSGAGAAGGLGFGLAAFLGAQLQPGFEVFAKRANLAERLRVADLAITGEGAIDRSTAMGKGVGQIARRCEAIGIPCMGLAGTVVRSREVSQRFSEVHALRDLTTVAEAKANPARWLEKLAARAAFEL